MKAVNDCSHKGLGVGPTFYIFIKSDLTTARRLP